MGKCFHAGQMMVFGIKPNLWPISFVRQSEHLNYFLHLIHLERNCFFIVHLGFLAFEDWSEGQELRKDTSDGPEIYGWSVMFPSEQKLWSSVPDCDHNLVTGVQGYEGFAKDPCKAKITNHDLSGTVYHDIGRFQITMHHPIGVQIITAMEKLIQNGPHSRLSHQMAGVLGVVMDELQQIVLAILKYHEDGFVLEYCLDMLNDVRMAEFGAESHLPGSGLRDTCVSMFAFSFGLKSVLDKRPGLNNTSHCSPLDCEVALYAVDTLSLVNSSICATANEASDLIRIFNLSFRGEPGHHARLKTVLLITVIRLGVENSYKPQ